MNNKGKVSLGRLATVGIALLCIALIVPSIFPIPVTTGTRNILSIGLSQNVLASPNYPYELVSERDRTGKVYAIGDNKFSLDCHIESVHYQENPDNPNDPWLEIDTTIVNSTKPKWDWEVTKGHWTLLISNNTTVALGKDGHWIGFRFDGVGYLHIDTKEYVVLFERGDVTPTVANNTIRWEGIVPGVNLEYVYGSDGFKENIEVTQQARTWLENNPPNNYGIPIPKAYLGAYFRCDWQNAYPAENENGDPISWNETHEFEGNQILFRHPLKDYIVTALPVGWARHDDLEPEDWVPILERFYQQGNNHWLILGSRVVDLNQMPEGTVIFDPSVDEQVDADLDDVHEVGTGTVQDHASTVIHKSHTTNSSKYWGAYRWVSASFPAQNSNITIAYAEMYVYGTTNDDVNGNWHFEKIAAPVQFSTSSYNVTGRTRTTASASDVNDGVQVGWYMTCGSNTSLVSPLQEVIDNYSPTALVLIYRPNSDAVKNLYTYSHNYNDGSYAAKIHIEWESTCTPSIANAPSTKDFGILAVNTTDNTAINYFGLNNTGSCAVDVTIQGTNLTGAHKFEYYDGEDDGAAIMHSSYWRGQTFQPLTTFNITGVKLLLCRYGTPGNITVSIKATDVDGLPTGADLCAGITNGNNLSACTSDEWREITFNTSYVLSAGTEYAIVARAPSGNSTNEVAWAWDTLTGNPPSYPRGCHVWSNDSGSSWGALTSIDLMFECWSAVEWVLSNTASPGMNVYGLYAGLDDDDDLFDVIVKRTATFNTLVSNLTTNSTQDWGLKIYMPTSVSYYGGQVMNGTVTLVASAAS